jgi:hypothetical protein
MPRDDARLVVAAIVKDNARTLGRLFSKLEGLRAELGELAFVVYENNSTDRSKSVLRGLALEIPSFTVVSEDIPAPRLAEIATVRRVDGSLCRIQVIAYARERLREAVLRERGDFDCALVIDADAAWFSVRGLARNVDRVSSGLCDSVCVNGMNKWLVYRDAYAYRDLEHPYGPEFLGDYWWDKVVARIQRRLRGEELLPVYSAFGGAAVYSMEAFRAGRYSAIPDPEFAAAQGKLDVSGARQDECLAASPRPIPNTNYLEPIVCEHVPFHYSMREAGFGRICVDPRWRMLFLD